MAVERKKGSESFVIVGPFFFPRQREIIHLIFHILFSRNIFFILFSGIFHRWWEEAVKNLIKKYFLWTLLLLVLRLFHQQIQAIWIKCGEFEKNLTNKEMFMGAKFDVSSSVRLANKQHTAVISLNSNERSWLRWKQLEDIKCWKLKKRKKNEIRKHQKNFFWNSIL